MKILKAIIIIVILLGCYHIATGQYISFKYDPKMTFVGLGHDYGDEKAFNWEIEAGYEFKDFRFSMSWEENHQIKYKKLTWLKLDLIFNDKLLWFDTERFNQFAGIETSVIYRADQRHFNTENSLSAGINIELEYRLLKFLYVGCQLNYFIAEATLKRDEKDMRVEGMLFIKYKS